VLPGYGVGVAGVVVVGGSVTLMVGSVGVGVGVGVGLLVVGVGAGLLVVGAGVGDVGAAVEALGLAGDFAAVGDVAFAGAPGVAGGPQDTLYAAGLDDTTAGLVTTSTTSPVAGTHAWNVSRSAAFVPAEAKVAVSGLVRSPSDIAQ
jgi:hypothetical protein